MLLPPWRSGAVTIIRREAWDIPGMVAGVETMMPNLTPDLNPQLDVKGSLCQNVPSSQLVLLVERTCSVDKPKQWVILQSI